MNCIYLQKINKLLSLQVNFHSLFKQEKYFQLYTHFCNINDFILKFVAFIFFHLFFFQFNSFTISPKHIRKISLKNIKRFESLGFKYFYIFLQGEIFILDIISLEQVKKINFSFLIV